MSHFYQRKWSLKVIVNHTMMGVNAIAFGMGGVVEELHDG